MSPPERSMTRDASPRGGADLVVDSVTGVDVVLPVAGPGARAFAFVLDWHIRVILLLAWYVVAALVYNRAWSLTPPFDPGGRWFGLVILPGVGLYVLYHAILEIAMRGRTPGKRWAGVRLVTRAGATPSIGALLTRNVFRIIDSFPVFYGIGLAATVLTRDHVRIGDLAAGTLLVYERGETLFAHIGSATAHAGRLAPTTIELANELLQRWNSLEGQARWRLARSLI